MTQRFCRQYSDSGATMIEYALICALFVLVVIAAQQGLLKGSQEFHDTRENTFDNTAIEPLMTVAPTATTEPSPTP